MSQRPAKPAHFPWLSPYLTVKNAHAALEFYQRAFGFEQRMAIPGPDGTIKHAELTYHDSLFMLGQEGNCDAKSPISSGVVPPMGLYVYSKDVDALFVRATEAGAVEVQPPQTMFWGDRVFTVTDPDGYRWTFATNVADFDPANCPK